MRNHGLRAMIAAAACSIGLAAVSIVEDDRGDWDQPRKSPRKARPSPPPPKKTISDLPDIAPVPAAQLSRQQRRWIERKGRG